MDESTWLMAEPPYWTSRELPGGGMQPAYLPPCWFESASGLHDRSCDVRIAAEGALGLVRNQVLYCYRGLDGRVDKAVEDALFLSITVLRLAALLAGPPGWRGIGGVPWLKPPAEQDRDAAAKTIDAALRAVGYHSGVAKRRQELLAVLDGVYVVGVTLPGGAGPAPTWYLALYTASGVRRGHTAEDKAAAEDLIARWHASTPDPKRSKYDAFNDFLGRFGTKYKDSQSVYALIKKDRRERGDR